AEAGLLPIERLALLRPIRAEIIGELVDSDHLERAAKGARVVEQVGDVAAVIDAEDQEPLDVRAADEVLEEGVVGALRIARNGLPDSIHAPRILERHFRLDVDEASQVWRLRVELHDAAWSDRRPALRRLHLHEDVANGLGRRSLPAAAGHESTDA